MPAISVIIPVFNGEKTIKASINSVLSQTFADFELIIINSSSNDATLEIVSQILDPRIQVYTHPQANVSVNRNIGTKYATGEFITFLDADDLWTPDKLISQYHALTKNPQAGVVYSWTNCIDENNKFLRKCSHVKWAGDVYTNFLLDDFIGSGSNVMIRSYAYMEVGGFDESLTNAQDTDLWLRLACTYDFEVVQEVQILYRILPNSMSSNTLGLETSNLIVIERAFAQKKAESLQHLKSYSLGNLYKYLSYKSLDVKPGSQKNLQVIRFLFAVIKYDPSLGTKPIIIKAFIKLLFMIVLPSQVTELLFKKYHKIFNTSTFLGYEILELK